MKNWIIGAILVLAAAAAYYYFAVYQPAGSGAPVAEQVVIVEPVKEPVEAPEVTDLGTAPDLVDQPEITVEVEEAPLPTLVDSDPVVLGIAGRLVERTCRGPVCCQRQRDFTGGGHH